MWISPDAARQFHSPYSYSPNPVNSVDPDGNQSVFGQYSGSYIWGSGGSGSVGVYADVGQGNAGAFVSGGLGHGYQIGHGFEVGFLRGDMEEAGGPGVVISGGFILGLNIYRSADLPDQGQKGRFIGASISLGAEAGGGLQATWTKLMPLERGGGVGAHPGSDPLISVPIQKSDATNVPKRLPAPTAKIQAADG